MGNIGFPELVVIFVVALLVFGPKRLPELGRSLGRGINEFRRASTDLKTSIQREMEDAEIESALSPTGPSQTAQPPQQTSLDVSKS
jgi:sec-independent protein translocase protein TatA